MASLELFAGLFHLGGLGPHETRNPVHGSQLVEHRSSDARNAIGLELDSPRQGQRRIDCIHQAKNARRDEIVEIHPFGKALPDALGVIYLDQAGK